MHHEYAAENYAANVENAQKYEWGVNVDMKVLKSWVECKDKDILAIAKRFGDEKTLSIVDLIIEKKDNRYFKVTEKMQFCVANDLLRKLTIEEIIKMLENKSFN